MDGFYAKRAELREKFGALVKNRASEEKYIEFVNSNLNKSSQLDLRTLEVILDLSLSVVDPLGRLDKNDSESTYFCAQNGHSGEIDDCQDSSNEALNQQSSYDADDEGLEEAFLFPCHITFDDCHPDLLCNYHQEYLKTSRTSTQLIRHPRLCEFAVEFLFRSLKNRLTSKISFEAVDDATGVQYRPTKLKEDYDIRIGDKLTDSAIVAHLNSIVLIVKRLTKVCANEKKNCRILARTNILNLIFASTLYLIEELPHKQHIYLETLMRFAFTLADFQITGENLKQLFAIIKNDNTDLDIVLNNFEQLLSHHYRILKNIQPYKSINFPTASRTAEEIESDSYLSNSWHWRLRSKVIEYKRKRSRSFEKQQVIRAITPNKVEGLNRDTEKNTIGSASPNANSSNFNKITPSWLECSLITPLSNISPLVHNGQVRLCCSLWMSLCGDLLVTNETKPKKNLDINSRTLDWTNLKGHWLRLASKKRLVRIIKDKRTRKGSRSRRLSMKIRRRQVDDKEDEERDELDEKIRRSEIEINKKSRRGFSKLINSPSGSISIRANKSFSSFTKKNPDTDSKKLGNQGPPRGFLGRRERDNSQEALMHLVSFAIDATTIEIWLNVRCMTFCARACRVAREGQTVLLKQVTFPSHLKADGGWSHIVFCLEETIGPQDSLYDRVMKLEVVVNGLHKEEEKLVYSSHKSPSTNLACLIGCERSTFGYIWKLSQLNIYKNLFPDDLIVYLLGKGPDFWSFSNFRQQSALPLPDVAQRNVKNLLNPKLLERYSEIDEQKALSWLAQNIVTAFVAHQPDFFLDYSSTVVSSSIMNQLSSNQDSNNSAEKFIQAKVLNFSRSLRFNINHGFGLALVEAGGIENVLVCFADVTRRAQNTSGTSHSLALAILFKMCQTNQHHLNKFLDELNGLKLVEFIMVHPDCTISKQMLNHYFDFCLMRRDDLSLLKSPRLIYHLISCWKAWHKDFQVAKIFYKRLIRLLQPNETLRCNLTQGERRLESYYINHNFNMMTHAGSLDLLIGILKECLVPLDDCAPKINHELVQLIVNLISLLIKHPPGMDVILEITDFLFFLHPDPNAYVETSSDRTSFLHNLPVDNDTDRSGLSTFRTTMPSSETSSSYQTSNENINYNDSTDFINGVEYNRSCSRTTDRSYASNEYTSEDFEDDSSNRNRMNFLNRESSFPISSARKKSSFIHSSQGEKCNSKDFAIANVADMLASIVKLSSTDPMKILTKAMQKSIIDPRKLIILANNSSALVREKVLRLFLYCIRACYSLNLRFVLNRYEQDRKDSSFKSCIPMQLMGRQLLKYPTTVKMIQLCYGIIVGIDDFENVDSVCLKFDIETMNNNLQLNALILLIQLMTQLREPKEIALAVEFVHAYLEQLMVLEEDDVLSILIENNLVDCLMKIYFSYVEHEVYKDGCNDNRADDIESLPGEFDELLKALDKTLILIVRYFTQNLSTGETSKRLDNLLTYFDLMNTYVPAKFHDILRDREVKILISLISYCKHYGNFARRKSCGGYMEYVLGNIFKIDVYNLNIFSNYLSSSQLELDAAQYSTDSGAVDVAGLSEKGEKLTSRTRSESEISAATATNGYKDDLYLKDDQANGIFNANLNDKHHYDDDFNNIRSEISRRDVVDRLRVTIEFAINFIVTREPSVIPSPLERKFIIRFVRTLSSYLDEYNGLLKKTKQSCQWFWILDKLMISNANCRSLREHFSLLILYLLSPCESMNLDERKYFVSEILKMFDAGHLVALLTQAGDKTNLKVMTMFMRDLIEHGGSQFNSEDSSCEQDDELVEGDIEDKLMILLRHMEQEIGLNVSRKNKNSKDQNKRVQVSSNGEIFIESKYCDIWLENLKQLRKNTRDRVSRLRIEYRFVHDNSTEESPDSSGRILNEALQITRDVIIDKNNQRKTFLEDIKQNKIYNYHVRQQWLSLIIGHTHERATWYLEDYYPKSWELNPVEGPSRIRRRLRPCKLILESRYFRCPKPNDRNQRSFTANQEARTSINIVDRMNRRTSSMRSNSLANDWYNHYSPHPLCSMIINHEQSLDSNELRTRMFTTDKIHFNCDCSIIRPNEVCEGEISIASWCIHFIGDRSDNCQQLINNQMLNKTLCQMSNSYHDAAEHAEDFVEKVDSVLSTNVQSVAYKNATGEISQTTKTNSSTSIVVEDLWFDEIVEIWDRRYQLQDVGLEIFLTNNMTYLLGFRTTRDKEEFKQSLLREEIIRKMINLQRTNLGTSLNRLTQIWRDGKLNNFDYLTSLNKLAGRSFNDLMQYPIFPFVLSNYTTNILDLNQASNFRDLKKPMAVQNQEKEATFINNYQDSQSNNLSVGLCGMKKPYHYGNHYSNSATVLHFLVRLPPFTQMLIQYQDNNFDQPDRTFHSMANTWQLITRDSNTDFKELIPEFFYLPEMFLNLEQFELGLKQNNELVDDVKLPPWCPNSDARLFTLIHRQALESTHVSENLNHWIDLIFGYKQIGKSAVDALNVFHPATYYGMIDLSSQSDQSNSSLQISSAIATLSAKSSTFGSDILAMVESSQQSTPFSAGETVSSSRRTLKSYRRAQDDIERLALETMIKTYGQMPRQLFVQPLKARVAVPFGKLNIVEQHPKSVAGENGVNQSNIRLEPLKRVKGLSWGSYVGSPDESDITAVKHRRVVPEDTTNKSKSDTRAQSLARPKVKFTLSLLPNGDIAILKDNTSIMLDYLADRKSGGYRTASNSARSWRTGLSSFTRDLNMIISRQQFSQYESNQIASGQLDTNSSSLISLTSSKVKFSPDSLSLISWFYLDGTIRIRHPASNAQKPNIPLVQAGSIIDSVSTCVSVPELNLLLVGYGSGSICAHIVSTSHETVPIAQHNGFSNSVAADALASSSAAPSAVHFVHTTTPLSSSQVPLGPGKVVKNLHTGESYTALSLAGQTLQSVRSVNKTTKWLYCHSKKINCMRINVVNGIIVTGSDDGTLVIWDLNSLTYVRTIDYKTNSLRKTSAQSNLKKIATDTHTHATTDRWQDQDTRLSDYLCSCNDSNSNDYSDQLDCLKSRDTKQGCICVSGVGIIAISDTLGDIVSIKDISNRIAEATESDEGSDCNDDMSGVSDDMYNESSSSSVLYCHTINGSLIGIVNCHSQVRAVCYSNAPEGISVNVIVVGLADGLISMYNSWDLSRVKEFHVSGFNLPISSLLYSRDNQLLYTMYEDGQLVVLKNQKKNSAALPKEWLL